MSKIESTIRDLSATGRKGFIPFVMAGDPDLETSLSIILKLADMGADVIEFGVPFSDPMADGPTIQRSSQRALANGTDLRKVFDLAARFRESSNVPLVLFSYLNPVLRFGIEEFAIAAARSGIDGVLFTDLIDDEAARISETLAASNIDLISLIAPTTSDARLKGICERARGFVYAVARTGITGATETMSDDPERLVTRARRFTNLPIVVGFGISTREQIAGVWRYADAVVVGSAIVAGIENANGDAVERVEAVVSALLP